MSKRKPLSIHVETSTVETLVIGKTKYQLDLESLFGNPVVDASYIFTSGAPLDEALQEANTPQELAYILHSISNMIYRAIESRKN